MTSISLFLFWIFFRLSCPTFLGGEIFNLTFHIGKKEFCLSIKIRISHTQNNGNCFTLFPSRLTLNDYSLTVPNWSDSIGYRFDGVMLLNLCFNVGSGADTLFDMDNLFLTWICVFHMFSSGILALSSYTHAEEEFLGCYKNAGTSMSAC